MASCRIKGPPPLKRKKLSDKKKSFSSLSVVCHKRYELFTRNSLIFAAISVTFENLEKKKKLLPRQGFPDFF